MLSDKLHLLQGFTDDERQLLFAMNRKEAGPHTSGLNQSTTILSPAERLNAGAFADDPVIRSVLGRMERVEAVETDYYLARRIEQTIEAFQEIARFLGGFPAARI